MASSTRRESIRGAVLDILHCGADPAPHWRALLGGGNPVGLARDVDSCVQCGERAEWNEDARSDHLLRDVLHARFACRRQTGDGQRPSAWPLSVAQTTGVHRAKEVAMGLSTGAVAQSCASVCLGTLSTVECVRTVMCA